MKRVTRFVFLLLGVVTTIGISIDAQENTSAAIARIRGASPAPLPQIPPIAGFGAGSGITIENNTQGTLVTHFLGATTKSVTIQPGDSTDVTLAAGNYEIAVEVAKSRAKPFYGQMKIDANVFYRLKFSAIVESTPSSSSVNFPSTSAVIESGVEELFDDTVWRGRSKRYEYTVYFYFGGKYVLEIDNLTPQPYPAEVGIKRQGYYMGGLTQIGLWRQQGNRITLNERYDMEEFIRGTAHDLDTVTPIRNWITTMTLIEREIILDGIQLKLNAFHPNLQEENGGKDIHAEGWYECTLTKIGSVFGALLDSKKLSLSLRGGTAESVAGTIWKGLQYGTWKPKPGSLEANQFQSDRLTYIGYYWNGRPPSLSLEFQEDGILTCTRDMASRFLRADNTPSSDFEAFFRECKMQGSWKQEGNRLLIKIGTSSRTCEKYNWENSENYEIEMRAVIVGSQMRGVTFFDYKNTKNVSEHQQYEWTLAKVVPSSQKGSRKVANKRVKR